MARRFLALVLAVLFTPLLRAEDPAPLELPGIHNAFRVTDRIFSGSQPEGDAAFAALERLGVKTIVSVDGAKPDVAAARSHGLRYIHLPFGYDGIPAERIAELARAATAGGDPVYVHCHHGLHRGPAAVGVMCEAVAGWSHERAEAWLRRAGTADGYPGLYRAVREFRAPSAGELARAGALPETAKTPALTDAMVAMDERLDVLKNQQRAGWNAIPENPDRHPVHVATLLWEQLRELVRSDDTAARPEDFRRHLADSEKSAALLRERLRTSPRDGVAIERAMKQVAENCTACHKAFRNRKE